MTTASIETHLAAGKLGTALAADALAVPIAARESDGTRGPLRLKATSHELTVNDADAATALAAILAKLSADPATQTTLAALLAKVIAAPATEAKQDALSAIIGTVTASPVANTLLARVKDLLTLIVLAAGTNNIGKVSPADDQDPIFDHTNAVLRATVTASTLLITPPAGCKYCRVSSTVDCYINIANGTAANDAGSIKIYAGQPEIISVVAAVNVNVFAASSAEVRATPLKAR